MTPGATGESRLSNPAMHAVTARGGAFSTSMPTGLRVRVYLSEADSAHHEATYVRILELLRREGAAGAGVFRGIAGFGSSGHIHTAAFPDVVQPLPIVLEWIDTPERVARLLPAVCAEAPEALVTVDDVHVAQAGRRVLRDVPKTIHVRDVMTPATSVDCVSPETSLHEIAVLLLRGRRRAVPVVDEGHKVVGIITNGDLVERGGLPLRLELLGALGDPEQPQVASHLTGLRGAGRTAASIMTPDPVTVGLDMPVAQAAGLMLSRRLKRLPVVAPNGALLGLLSRMDVLKTATVGYPPTTAIGTPAGERPTAADADEPARTRDWEGSREADARNGQPPTRRIGAVMKRDVPTVRPDTPLPEVLDAIVSTRLNRAVVVDSERRPIGLIVDVDLMQRVTPAAHPGVVEALMRRVLPGSDEQREQWRRLTGHTARDLMRPRDQMLVVPEDADVADVIDDSLEQRVKLVAVVDDSGRLVGMADRADLLAALAPA